MTRTLLILIAAIIGFKAGYNNAMQTVFHNDVFGDASVKEIEEANNVWKGN